MRADANNAFNHPTFGLPNSQPHGLPILRRTALWLRWLWRNRDWNFDDYGPGYWKHPKWPNAAVERASDVLNTPYFSVGPPGYQEFWYPFFFCWVCRSDYDLHKLQIRIVLARARRASLTE